MTWIKKQYKLLAITMLLLCFLLHPFAVLAEIRIDFAKEDYSSGGLLEGTDLLPRTCRDRQCAADL